MTQATLGMGEGWRPKRGLPWARSRAKAERKAVLPVPEAPARSEIPHAGMMPGMGSGMEESRESGEEEESAREGWEKRGVDEDGRGEEGWSRSR